MSYTLTKRFFGSHAELGLRRRLYVVLTTLQAMPETEKLPLLLRAQKHFSHVEALELFRKARRSLPSLTLDECIAYFDALPFPSKTLSTAEYQQHLREVVLFWKYFSDLLTTPDDLMKVVYRMGPDHRLAFVIQHAKLIQTKSEATRFYDELFTTLQAYELDGPRSSLVPNLPKSRLAFNNAIQHVLDSSQERDNVTALKQ